MGRALCAYFGDWLLMKPVVFVAWVFVGLGTLGAGASYYKFATYTDDYQVQKEAAEKKRAAVYAYATEPFQVQQIKNGKVLNKSLIKVTFTYRKSGDLRKIKKMEPRIRDAIYTELHKRMSYLDKGDVFKPGQYRKKLLALTNAQFKTPLVTGLQVVNVSSGAKAKTPQSASKK